MNNNQCCVPFCTNQASKKSDKCGSHVYEQAKNKIKTYKELLPLWSVKRCSKHGLLRSSQVYNSKKDGHLRCIQCERHKKIPYDPIKQRIANERTKKSRRNANLKRLYNLDEAGYEKLLSSQNNRCAICKKDRGEFTKKSGKYRKLAVDHCHITGKIRGILCTSCNWGIGHLTHSIENLKSAIYYLEYPPYK